MVAPVPASREVMLIRKQECRLCDVAREALSELAPEMGFRVHEIDIGEDATLAELYRHAVPVVRASGLTLLSGRMDAESLRQELTGAFGPDPLAGVPEHEPEFLAVLECPVCGGTLESRPRAVACLYCGHEYHRDHGVLILMAEPERPSRLRIMDWIGSLIGFRLKDPVE